MTGGHFNDFMTSQHLPCCSRHGQKWPCFSPFWGHKKKAVNLLNGLTASNDSQNKNVTNTSHLANPQHQHSANLLGVLVGARGFECARGAQASSEACFTRLRRAPTPSTKVRSAPFQLLEHLPDSSHKHTSRTLFCP